MTKEILFYGEHPFCFTGNGNMMCAMLTSIDTDKYHAACLCAIKPETQLYDIFRVMPFNLISVSQGGDVWGLGYLLEVLRTKQIAALVTVGVDIWRFAPIMKEIRQALTAQGVPWIGVLPYDTDKPNKGMFDLMAAVDIPCIYSKFGFNMVEGNVKNARYFRPDLFGKSMYMPLSREITSSFRNAHFSTFDKDSFVFGFVGANQVRKEPYKVVKAFLAAQKILEGERNIGLYMHTESMGVYNLGNLGENWGVPKPQTIAFKQAGKKYSIHDMVHVFNSIDCLVLPSLQEGLSWTPIEAMLCKTPVLLSDTTAHKELIDDPKCLVPCTEPMMIPIVVGQDHTHLEALACSIEDLTDYMVNMARLDKEQKEDMVEENYAFAKQWVDNVDNICDVLDDTFELIESQKMGVGETKEKNGRVLFMQHSSGGDVLMTTRCFKGLKDRHPDMELDFMTMPQYIGIVEGNPIIDKIIPWDTSIASEYSFIYNPHGDRILPGHWGRNANSILADFYWKLLKVKPTPPIISLDMELPEWVTDSIDQDLPLCIVHTTGGDPAFRTYKYMSDVCEALEGRYYTIQMGGADDYPAAADLDLRGQLSYRQEAYLMKLAALAITVDSFMSHLAGAMGVSQIALYGSGNASVCQPLQVGGKLITLIPDYIRFCKGLGPCSASIRDCPIPCTGLHDPKVIISAINELEKEGAL